MTDLMTFILLAVLVITVFIAGIMFERVTSAPKRHARPPDEQQTVLVKRNRPSFRNPAKTRTTAYDEYKTSKGLYAPVKPGKGSRTDEVDVQER